MAPRPYDDEQLKAVSPALAHPSIEIDSMAGDFVPESELNLKGMQKHFNSFTRRGRFNFVVATYGTIFGTYFLYKIFKKKPAPAAVKSP